MVWDESRVFLPYTFQALRVQKGASSILINSNINLFILILSLFRQLVEGVFTEPFGDGWTRPALIYHPRTFSNLRGATASRHCGKP